MSTRVPDRPPSHFHPTNSDSAHAAPQLPLNHADLAAPRSTAPLKSKTRSKRSDGPPDPSKRRCVSTACIACRKRKSKCDGNTPACAACSSVYGTDCVYDLNSDHRRKGVYRQDIDNLKDRTNTLQTLVECILKSPQDDVLHLVNQIRGAESLDHLAERLAAKERGIKDEESEPTTPTADLTAADETGLSFESQLSTKLGQLRVESGSTRFFGGTSNLVYYDDNTADEKDSASHLVDVYQQQPDPITSWTNVTHDAEFVMHLLNMYFTWHYTFFVALSKSSFYRDFMRGRQSPGIRRKSEYCTPLLVNAMLALGCHFTSRPGACEDPSDPDTAGDHFFREAKRIIMDEEEYEHPKLATVQALALMSVREAGCGREAKGWTYSGISFRMACDLGLNLDAGGLASNDSTPTDEEEDARRMTFWGCFLFDKCWSNYLGRLPHFQSTVNITCPKFDVFPIEEAENWTPYTDSGFGAEHTQPSRVRTVARYLSDLCDISSDLMRYFYHPQQAMNPPSKQIEIKRLGEIHTRLEAWKRELPQELDSREGALPSVLVMHMFFHLLYIHLFRPFLRYDPKSSPLPSNVSPRRQCTHGASAISKILRLYKRSYGLRQICNIVVYIAHSACTIHLLNLPDKNARRDITHGVKQLEEIAGSWQCARRTLCVLSVQARKWKVDLPEDAAAILRKVEQDSGPAYSSSGSSPQLQKPHSPDSPTFSAPQQTAAPQQWSQSEDMNSMSFTNNDQILLDALDVSLEDMVRSGAALGFDPRGAQAVPAGRSYGGDSSLSLSSPGSDSISPQAQAPQMNWHQSTSGSSLTSPPSAHSENGLFQQNFSFPNGGSASHQQNAQHVLMQPPPVPRSQARPQHQTQHQTQHRPAAAHAPQAQANHDSKARHSRQAKQAPSGRRPSATDAMFGGVQALLAEGQDYWLRDQSQVASGFGNWRTASHPTTPTDAAELAFGSANGLFGGIGGSSTRSSTNGNTGVNRDTQCAVPETKGVCPRGLDCDAHALDAKRAVPGRSQPFDMLLGAAVGRHWEAERERAHRRRMSAAGEHGGGADDGLEWCG